MNPAPLRTPLAVMLPSAAAQRAAGPPPWLRTFL